MSKVVVAALAVTVIGGGYLAATQFGLFESSSPAQQQLKTAVVNVPAPTRTTVANRAPVMEDRKALAVYSEHMKSLYRVGYFQKIQMAREAELDAKIAGSMAAIRKTGYMVGPSGELTENPDYDVATGSFRSAQSNTLATTTVTTDTQESQLQALLDKENLYTQKTLLDSARLMMIKGDVGTFKIGDEYVDLAQGESLGALTVSTLDTERGRAILESPDFQLRRSLILSTQMAASTRKLKSSPANTAVTQTPQTSTPSSASTPASLLDDAPPMARQLLNTMDKLGLTP